ncbi:MAG: hypothetical protein R3E64_03530 [Halioglobus sp.]
MTIEELGNLGDFLAAIATIITLIYLALQIRQSTSLLKLSELRGIQDDADRWRSLLIENKDVASIYRRGLLDPESLDADDRLRFRMLQDQLFFGWQAIFSQNTANPKIARGFIKSTLTSAGGKMYWQKSKFRFNQDFVEYVDQVSGEA